MKILLTKLIKPEVKKVFTEAAYNNIVNGYDLKSMDALIYEVIFKLPPHLMDYRGSWGKSEIHRLVADNYPETVHRIAEAVAIKIIKHEMGLHDIF